MDVETDVFDPTPTDQAPWLWKPGQSGNPKGRPRRGETYLDKLIKAMDESAGPMIAGLIRKAIEGDVRAHVYLRDTILGVPKQTLQMEGETDSPYQLMLGALVGRLAGTSLNDSLPPLLESLNPAQSESVMPTSDDPVAQ